MSACTDYGWCDAPLHHHDQKRNRINEFSQGSRSGGDQGRMMKLFRLCPDLAYLNNVSFSFKALALESADIGLGILRNVLVKGQLWLYPFFYKNL